MIKLKEKCDNLRESLEAFRQTKKIGEKISAVNILLKNLAQVMATVRAIRQNYITKTIVENEKKKSVQILEVSDKNRNEIEGLYEVALSKFEEALNIMAKMMGVQLKNPETGEIAKMVSTSDGLSIKDYVSYYDAIMKYPSYRGPLSIGIEKLEEILVLIENLDFLKSS